MKVQALALAGESWCEEALGLAEVEGRHDPVEEGAAYCDPWIPSATDDGVAHRLCHRLQSQADRQAQILRVVVAAEVHHLRVEVELA